MLKLFSRLKHNLALTLNSHKANLVSHFSSNTNCTVRNKGKQNRNKRKKKEKKNGRKEEKETFCIIIN